VSASANRVLIPSSLPPQAHQMMTSKQPLLFLMHSHQHPFLISMCLHPPQHGKILLILFLLLLELLYDQPLTFLPVSYLNQSVVLPPVGFLLCPPLQSPSWLPRMRSTDSPRSLPPVVRLLFPSPITNQGYYIPPSLYPLLARCLSGHYFQHRCLNPICDNTQGHQGWFHLPSASRKQAFPRPCFQ